MGEEQVFLKHFGGDFDKPLFDMEGVGDDVNGAAIYSYGSNLTLLDYKFSNHASSKEDKDGYDLYGLFAFYVTACKLHEMDGSYNFDSQVLRI